MHTYDKPTRTLILTLKYHKSILLLGHGEDTMISSLDLFNTSDYAENYKYRPEYPEEILQKIMEYLWKQVHVCLVAIIIVNTYAKMFTKSDNFC